MAEGVSLGPAVREAKTDKAILVILKNRGDSKVWIPKSVVHEDSEVWAGEGGEEGELLVEEWWAEKEGWT